jgi:hypothetical protein
MKKRQYNSKMDIESLMESMVNREIEKFKRSMNGFLRDFESEQRGMMKDYLFAQFSSGELFNSGGSKRNSRGLSGRQMLSDVFDNLMKNFF